MRRGADGGMWTRRSRLPLVGDPADELDRAGTGLRQASPTGSILVVAGVAEYVVSRSMYSTATASGNASEPFDHFVHPVDSLGCPR